MPAGSIAEVLDLYERWGPERYDEDVSQLDHALQTAALARAEGASDALVAAALLHDVGHLLELRDGGRADGAVTIDLGHEGRGARYLGALLPPSVTGPIALHVLAKRYRCAVDPAYAEALSPGSVRSLARQGGPLDAAGIERFEAHPAHADAVALRGWDDGGKVDGLVVAPLRSYEPALAALAALVR
jgi:predicted HD phosphohydrolase